MGYRREDYVRIKAEFSEKYLRARTKAEERRQELYAKIPDVRQLDALLAGTAAEIMEIILKESRETAAQKTAELKHRNEKLLAERAAILTAYGYPADYSDVHYECPLCGDTGFVDTKMCVCMKKALVLAGYESSGLGGLIRTQSFDNFSLKYYRDNPENLATMEKVVAGLRRFAGNFDRDTYRNYLMLGPTGLGKTHLSTAVAKEVIERGFDVLYVTSVGMVGDFEEKRFGNGEGRDTARYYECDLLIIDDLGTEVTNQFTLSCLYDVINTRINNRRCTFINTNLTTREIEARYSERITSRLLGEYLPIRFCGTDIRKQKLFEKR